MDTTPYMYLHTHTCTHARTHARTHTHCTHTYPMHYEHCYLIYSHPGVLKETVIPVVDHFAPDQLSHNTSPDELAFNVILESFHVNAFHKESPLAKVLTLHCKVYCSSCYCFLLSQLFQEQAVKYLIPLAL